MTSRRVSHCLLGALERIMRSTLCAIAAVSLFCLVACGLRADEPQRDALDFFENEIRPLLISRCVSCHGPKKSESSLDCELLKFGSNQSTPTEHQLEKSVANCR